MKHTDLQKLFNSQRFNIQLFAEDGASEDTAQPETGEDEKSPDEGKTGDGGDHDEKKYSDADLDRILSKKFAKWQKQQEQHMTEAQKLAERNASRKSEDRIKVLEDKLGQYEREHTHAQMMTQARAMLQDEHISVSDGLLGSFVTDDADTTEKNVNEFVKMFREAVSREVKAELKGASPKTGGSASKLTKAQILAIKNPLERQNQIREHMNLFK